MAAQRRSVSSLRDRDVARCADMARTRLVRQLLSRGRGPLLAIVDQAIYALSNLLLQIGVARSVPDEVFGAFTVASSFFVVLAMAHQTFVVEPMFVLGQRRFSQSAATYYGMLRSSWSVGFGIGAALVGLLLAWILYLRGAGSVAAYTAAYAIAAPVLLYFWLMRRMAFALSRTEIAVAGNAVYGTIMLAGLAFLMLSGRAGPYSGIALSALAATAGAIVISGSISWPRHGQVPPQDALRLHVRYGRWAFGSEMISWGIANCAMLLLPLWLGLGASAVMRVLILLFMPLLQACSAMTLLLLRRSSADGNQVTETRTVARHWLAFFGIAAAYSLCIVLVAPPMIPLVFGKAYEVRSSWIMLAAVTSVLMVSVQALFVALRVVERPQDVMAAHICALAVILALLVGFSRGSVAGALASQAAGWFIANALAAWFIVRHARRVIPSAANHQWPG